MPWLLPLLAPLALATSVAELAESGARAGAVVEACRAHPSGCTDAGTREALGRAFYTTVLERFVHGAPADPADVGNVAALNPALFARLPAALRASAGAPSTWVAQLVAPPTPSPVVARAPRTEPPTPELAPPPPEPEPPPLVAARRQLRAGDAQAAIRTLSPLAEAGHDKARALLALALEEVGLPAAALLTLQDLLAGPSAELYGPYVTTQAVRLADAVGTRRPLVELAATVPAERWAEEVRGDAWLATGQLHQERGELQWALSSFRRVDPADDAYVEAAWRSGLLYRQVDKPWAAVAAFRSAWNASGGGPERLRDAAIWNMAALFEELGRPEEAIATYEALTLTASPLAERSAVRSAWAAARVGDADRSQLLLRLVDPADPPPEVALLRARLALVAGDHASAAPHVADVLAGVDRGERALRALLADPTRCWDRLDDVALPASVRRHLASDLSLAAYEAELRAMDRDRAHLATLGLPADVVAALDARLADRAALVTGRATTALFHVLSDLVREAEHTRALAEGLLQAGTSARLAGR